MTNARSTKAAATKAAEKAAATKAAEKAAATKAAEDTATAEAATAAPTGEPSTEVGEAPAAAPLEAPADAQAPDPTASDAQDPDPTPPAPPSTPDSPAASTAPLEAPPEISFVRETGAPEDVSVQTLRKESRPTLAFIDDDTQTVLTSSEGLFRTIVEGGTVVICTKRLLREVRIGLYESTTRVLLLPAGAEISVADAAVISEQIEQSARDAAEG